MFIDAYEVGYRRPDVSRLSGHVPGGQSSCLWLFVIRWLPGVCGRGRPEGKPGCFSDVCNGFRHRGDLGDDVLAIEAE